MSRVIRSGLGEVGKNRRHHETGGHLDRDTRKDFLITDISIGSTELYLSTVLLIQHYYKDKRRDVSLLWTRQPLRTKSNGTVEYKRWAGPGLTHAYTTMATIIALVLLL